MNTLALPVRAWSVMTLATESANPYRFRRESGGWLLARAEAPTEVVAATGPGANGVLQARRVWIDHAEFAAAARAQDLVVVGEWHCHSDGARTEASPGDKNAWRTERLNAAAETWPAVILARGSDGTWKSGSATGFVTTRTGCERVNLSPRFGPSLLEAAAHQSWAVSKGPLLRTPSTREPGELRSTIACLEVDDEAYESVQLERMNERLKRLGFAGNHRPLSRPRRVAPSGPTAGEVIHGGERIVRPGIGQVLGVR